jgi:16S rRNA (cytosine967-C5)-methyltransferase
MAELAERAQAPGLLARRIAADILEGVLQRRQPLDQQLADRASEFSAMAERDRALVRALAATVLRRLGTLRQVLQQHLKRGFPKNAPRVETALLVGAAQILWLDVPDHAAVDLAVRLAQPDRPAARYASLVNAVLRQIIRDGKEQLAGIDSVRLDTPDWLMARWARHYGVETARAIAAAHGHESALDLTVKDGAQHWADALQGRVLPTGSVRVVAHGSVAQFPGYAEGAWWVQDAAAALPARFLGDVKGQTVADLCAAPGGKTAQLAAAGARVIAVDRSASRLDRLRENLARLNLSAEIVAADVLEWRAPAVDAVLLDAPCSSTGTIRRHPDIPWIKQEADIAALASLQWRLIERAADMVKPGGRLIYCTCSLEPEEGTDIVRGFLASHPQMQRIPIDPGEMDGSAEWLTPEGDLRTLPCHLSDPNSMMAGLDGFYAARLERV